MSRHMLKKYAGIVLIALLALAFWLGRQSASPHSDASPPGNQAAPVQAQSQPTAVPAMSSGPKKTMDALPDFLPAEAETT
ncbi:MAG: hypothetical protein ABIP02_01100, partial [Arenimonas sp.]